MPAFFTQPRGKVVRVVPSGGGPVMPFQIKMEGFSLGSGVLQARAIITQASIKHEGNYQFLHTLNETIYAYVFGDHMGILQIGGIAFSSTCWGTGTEGIQQVIQAYNNNRIAKAPKPCLVNFGATPYKGFLVGMDIDIAEAESQLGKWSFSFRTFPGG